MRAHLDLAAVALADLASEAGWRPVLLRDPTKGAPVQSIAGHGLNGVEMRDNNDSRKDRLQAGIDDIDGLMSTHQRPFAENEIVVIADSQSAWHEATCECSLLGRTEHCEQFELPPAHESSLLLPEPLRTMRELQGRLQSLSNCTLN